MAVLLFPPPTTLQSALSWYELGLSQLYADGYREKTILFGLTGTGYFEMVAYEKFHDEAITDNIPTDEDIAQPLAKLPVV